MERFWMERKWFHCSQSYYLLNKEGNPRLCSNRYEISGDNLQILTNAISKYLKCKIILFTNYWMSHLRYFNYSVNWYDCFCCYRYHVQWLGHDTKSRLLHVRPVRCFLNSESYLGVLGGRPYVLNLLVLQKPFFCCVLFCFWGRGENPVEIFCLKTLHPLSREKMRWQLVLSSETGLLNTLFSSFP